MPRAAAAGAARGGGPLSDQGPRRRSLRPGQAFLGFLTGWECPSGRRDLVAQERSETAPVTPASDFKPAFRLFRDMLLVPFLKCPLFSHRFTHRPCEGGFTTGRFGRKKQPPVQLTFNWEGQMEGNKETRRVTSLVDVVEGFGSVRGGLASCEAGAD